VTDEEAYHLLSAYTLSHRDPAFVHQYVVDAYGAQHTVADAKPIRLAFSLIGLYMHVERGFSGREVQRVHKVLGDRTHSWPAFDLPLVGRRGSMTVIDVVAAPEGFERDAAIDAWCRSVWAAFASSRPSVEALLQRHGVI
jgi:hypothetical protein